MSTAARRAAIVAGSLLLLGAAGAAAVPEQWAGGVLPAPGERAAEAPVVTLDPVAVRLACAGPPEATMGETVVVDPSAPPQDSARAAERLVVTFPRTDAAPAPASLGETPLGELGPLRALGDAAEASAVLDAPPSGGRSAAPAGLTIATAGGGDLRGLVAHPCAAPRDVAWLVGGGTQVGESTQVRLRNVGRTPATVDVTAWGSLGALAAPALRGVTVAPGEETSVLVEGAVAPDPSLALRIEVSGGEVAAWAQSLRLDGLVPAGISAVPVAAAPATQLLVPVPLDGGSDETATLRLVNPGDAEARVRIGTAGPGGPAEALPEQVVAAGAVLDVPLASAGATAVVLDSDRPITAAVGLRRAGTPSLLDPDTPPADIAWAPALDARATSLWALPRAATGAEARLVLAAQPGATGTATLTAHADDGTTREIPVEIPAGAAPAVDVPSDAVALALTADVPVAASVLLTSQAADGGLVELVPGMPDPHADQALRVDLR